MDRESNPHVNEISVWNSKCQQMPAGFIFTNKGCLQRDTTSCCRKCSHTPFLILKMIKYDKTMINLMTRSAAKPRSFFFVRRTGRSICDFW